MSNELEEIIHNLAGVLNYRFHPFNDSDVWMWLGRFIDKYNEEFEKNGKKQFNNK